MSNTYNTGNPLGSTDPRDLFDNASNFDDGMNAVSPSFTDRLGVLRKTWSGMESEFDTAQAGREAEFQQFLVDSGFVSLGNYTAGLNFTAYNQYMARDGFFYRPAPSTVPFTTTGTWVGGDEDLFVLLSADDVLRQDLSDDTDLAKGDALLAVNQPGSSLGRTQHDKNAERYYLADFPSIDLTGSTDSTVYVQAAIDYCATNGIDLHTGRGTVLVSSLTGQSDLTLVGPGYRQFTFKRLASAATGSVFDFDGKTNFKLAGFTVDGNKAAVTNAGTNITIGNSCSDYMIEDIASINAHAVSGFGNGFTVIGVTSGSQAGSAYIRKCRVTDNEGAGIQVTRVSGLTVENNFVYLNAGVGVDVINLVYPPVADVANDLQIANNRCNNNLIGIRVLGYYRGGSMGAPIYGIEIPASRHVNILGNHCLFNVQYGIVYQGANGIISGNHISRNGTAAGNGGALLNAWRTQFIGNNVEDNYYYGIDAGGAVNCIINHNEFIRNGATAGTGNTDINLGAAQDSSCSFNRIDQTSVVGSCFGINAPRWDGDGVKYFPTLAQHLDISENEIVANGDAGSVGIYLRQGPSSARITNNRLKAIGAGKDFVVEGTNVTQFGNFSNLWPTATGELAASSASAATTVISDTADVIYVSGTTTITRLHTASAEVFYQKVFKVDMTNAGTGYTSAPAVSFTGGGGSGAAGTALLGSDGTIIGVEITAPGTGYTSAPTVGFTGGGGTGAAGTAVVGCYNFANRVVKLVLQGAITVTDGGNLALAGNLVGAAGSTLTLMGYAGSWAELSRAVI